MKRYTATVHISIDANSIEARDCLLKMLTADITRHKPTVSSIGAGTAQVRRAVTSRVRPAKR
jgi:hypothetical protein